MKESDNRRVIYAFREVKPKQPWYMKAIQVIGETIGACLIGLLFAWVVLGPGNTMLRELLINLFQ